MSIKIFNGNNEPPSNDMIDLLYRIIVQSKIDSTEFITAVKDDYSVTIEKVEDKD